MTRAVYIQDSDFNALLTYSDSEPVVVHYTAARSGSCRVISPLIDKLAEEYTGRAKVVKIDVDRDKANAKKFNIRSIPAIQIFKEGEVVETLVGTASYETLSEALEKHL